MQKISFKDDYSEGAHPTILKALIDTNFIQTIGYGDDQYSLKAAELIKKKIDNANADIHFISGGTQANLTAISSFLKPYQSVISAKTAHIATHETGAIEATGHKINTVETPDGKLKPDDIKQVLEFHTDEHMVMPKLVFISNSTELGTIYSKKELSELALICKKNNLYLYLDGARLASALTSEKNDLTLSDISNLTDAFYIGGTKNGALIGEAMVISNEKFKENFRFNMKQKGALLAKGRLIGIQFYELFKTDLFFKSAEHANQQAEKLADAVLKKGYKFFTEPSTNQIFPILPNRLIKKLHQKFDFYIWTKFDETHSVARLVCSWATKEEFVDLFISELD